MIEDQKQKYLELQTIEQQLQQVQEQINVLQQQITELLNNAKSLEALATVKPNTAMYAPICSGVYVAAEIKEVNHVLINSGADVLVKKTIGEAKEMMEKQAEEMQALFNTAQENVQKMTGHAQKIQHELIALQTEQSKKEKK